MTARQKVSRGVVVTLIAATMMAIAVVSGSAWADSAPASGIEYGDAVPMGDGTARVKYRGAQWTAAAVPGAPLEPGPHRVREVVGNRLVLEKI